MDTEEFFKMLEYNDWYYAYSDDHRVWTAGERKSSQIQSLVKENTLFKRIYDDWVAYVFGGENFGKPEAPKPKLEDYL